MAVLNCLIAVLVLLISFIYWYVKSSFSYWKSKGVPHDEPDVPFGNITKVGKSLSLVYFIQNYYNKFKGTKSKICGFYVFTQPVTILLDLDLIKNVLVKEFATFSDRGLYYNDEDDPLSGHLVALNGQKFKNIRVKLTPTFTSGKMKYMYSTITTVGDRLNEYVTKAIRENDELETKSILAKFTMDIIGTCAFGIECNTLNDSNNDFYQMGRTAMEKTRHNPRFMSLLNSNLAPWGRFFGVKAIRDEVSKFFMGVVKSTIEYRERHNIERNDFMDLLIKLKTEDNEGDVNKGLTVNEIAAQSFLFFAAGYETSSTTMLFALYELALNPKVQTKLRHEIHAAFKRHSSFSYEMMMDIPYLDQTINETLRKYPPFTTLRRISQSAYKIPDTNIIIDKGLSVLVPVYAIQNDPAYFPEPNKFDPDRFSPKETKNRHPMAFLPFGEGPRNCIAQRFGMMQTRIGLISLLHNFEFATCEKTLIPMVFINTPFVLSPKEDIYLKIKIVDKK